MKKNVTRVIVTGGAGFIGSHLAELLVNEGWDVTIIDDLSTGKMSNIEPLLGKTNIHFIKGSINEIALLQRLFYGIQFVFHEAAIASVARSIENPLESQTVNIIGTLNVLLAARDNKVKKVVCASSSAIYGESPVLPYKEDSLPNPQSPYAVTKLAMENYCQVFSQLYHLPTICLRYFNVYGPKQDPLNDYAAVIPKFLKKALNGDPLVIYGDGEQSRDFVYVGDVVRANLLAAKSDATGSFNIGTGKSISINDLVELIARTTRQNIKIIHENARPGDPRKSMADISKARELGYEPIFDLNETLGNIIMRHMTEVE